MSDYKIEYEPGVYPYRIYKREKGFFKGWHSVDIWSNLGDAEDDIKRRLEQDQIPEGFPRFYSQDSLHND